MELTAENGETHPGRALTAYCFDELSDSEREAVEQHLFVCDRCWAENQRLMSAVLILRAGNALPPPFTAAEVVSVFGISSRLTRPFGGHRTFAIGAVTLFALQFFVGVWVELGYSYGRFGQLAWVLSWPAGLLAGIAVLLGMFFDADAVRQGSDDGLVRSVLTSVVGLALVTAGLVYVLPAEPTIRASFQTRTAATGYLKDVLVVFGPVLFFILPSFHTILTLQQSLGTGRYEPVFGTLTPSQASVPPRGLSYLSPQVLGAVFLVLGLLRLYGANHMLDALTPGPYAQLFSIMTYLNVGLWLAATIWSIWWFWTMLSEVKREAITLARLTSPQSDRSRH